MQICFLLKYLQIYSFLSGFPLHSRTTQYKQTDITETFQPLLSNNTHSGTNKQNTPAGHIGPSCSAATFNERLLISSKADRTKDLVIGAVHVGWHVYDRWCGNVAQGKATRNSAKPIIRLILNIISITIRPTVIAITVRYPHCVINCKAIHPAVFQRYQIVNNQNRWHY